jgi:hypothetical protein
MSAFLHILTYVAPLTALVGVIGRTYCKVSRARLLRRAGDTALEKGYSNPQGKAGLQIVDKLTCDEPWYRAILPWGKSGDDQP